MCLGGLGRFGGYFWKNPGTCLGDAFGDLERLLDRCRECFQRLDNL